MNKAMKAQFGRMKQAWIDHDPTVDKVDDNCLPEIAGIVSETEAEVRETLEASYWFMNTQSVHPAHELCKTDTVLATIGQQIEQTKRHVRR